MPTVFLQSKGAVPPLSLVFVVLGVVEIMPKLTKNFIENLALPEDGQVIVRDDVLKGFGIRLTPGCIAFIAEGRLEGKNKRVTVGRFPELAVDDARMAARRALAEMAIGNRGLNESTGILTLRTVMNGFLEVRNLKPVTKIGYRRQIERNLVDWLDLPVTEITHSMCEQKHKSLMKPTRCGTDGKCTANSTFEILRVMLRWAAQRYQIAGKPLIMFNPVDRISHNRQWFRLNPRQGTIPDDRLPEFYRWVMKEPKIARDFILLLLFSALRRSEGAQLRWQDIDWERRIMTIQENKSGRPHVLPLTDIMFAILESRKRNGSDYVFEGRYSGHLNEPRQVIARLREKMDLHWLLHDLRRTALSCGQKISLPWLSLKVIANHKLNRSDTERYIVLDSSYLREHMDSLNNRLLELMCTSVEKWKSQDSNGYVFEPNTMPLAESIELECQKRHDDSDFQSSDPFSFANCMANLVALSSSEETELYW